MPRKTTRNPQGGGTIRRRSDGRWEARFTVGRDPGTGKQVKSPFMARHKRKSTRSCKRLVPLWITAYISSRRKSLWDNGWIFGLRHT